MAVTEKRRNNITPSCTPSKRRKELELKYEIKIRPPGAVLTLGVGDTGQLGLGPEILDRTKPARFSADSLLTAGLDEISAERFVQVVAGGMHTVCLTVDGRVFTFGCNDEGALGRLTTEEEGIQPEDEKKKTDVATVVEESRPGLVVFPEFTHIVMISAGDSHTAALDSDGRVWLWGTFRGASGVLGLTTPGEIRRSPMLLIISSLSVGTRILKISSGQDHLVCLTDDGRLYTMGCGEQGQLGRVAERFAKDGGRNGLELLLQPAECRIRGLVRFIDVWAGGFATIARSFSNGAIYACGLNNYGQLGLLPTSEAMPHTAVAEGTVKVELESHADPSITLKQGSLVQFMLTRALGFDVEDDWSQFAIGMHHTLALTSAGEVYAIGRSDYGRLGFPIPPESENSAVVHPLRVTGCLEDRKCVWIGCGEACSFAVDENGIAFAWGMGSSQQLAQDDEDQDVKLPAPMLGKNLLSRRTIMVDAGGQHTVILASDPSFHELASEQSIKYDEKLTSESRESMDCTSDDSANAKLKSFNSESGDDLKHNLTESTGHKNLNNFLKAPVDYVYDDPDISALRSEMSVIDESKSILNRENGIDSSQNLKLFSMTNLTAKNDMLSPTIEDCPSVCSTIASTARATVNSSSLRSCSIASSQPVSDTASSCSNTSADSAPLSQVSSAHSTDGGGSSRLSSLGAMSVQSSLFAQPQDETQVMDTRMDDGRRRGQLRFPMPTSRGSYGGGMSICSTNSEMGLPNDTTSLGSMTASPMDMISGEMGTGSFPLS